MAQAIIPNGFFLGAPGAIGSPAIYLFADSGDPNSVADPLSLLAGCSLGTLFVQTDSPALWQKTGASSASMPTGVWTAIS